MLYSTVKKIIGGIVFIAAFNTIEHITHEQTDGFSLRRTQFDQPLQTGEIIHQPELDQTFHYLACGNQSYVFLSSDGQYVLKLFKYANTPAPHFMTKIPLLNYFKPFKPHRHANIFMKRERDYRGYQLAFDRFKEESSIIAVHLSPIERGYPTITLYDKLNCRLTVNLNETPFVLQRKATPAFRQLKTWIRAGQIDIAKEAIENLKILLQKRISLNLLDDDVNFYSNLGFVGKQPVQVDPGHFIDGATPDPDLEIATLTQKLTTWCQKHAPELL